MLALSTCAKAEPKEPEGGGDIDNPALKPGGPGTTAQSFDPAKEAALRAERDKRWHTLETTLRKADAKTLWDRGQEQEKSQNWKEAQEAYQALVVFFPKDANAPKAVERAMRTAFRRAEYGEGFQFFEDALPTFDPLPRARLLRVLAASELAVPHWGTTRASEYLRGRYEQGKQTQTYAEDRAKAISLLESARDLFAQANAPKNERATLDIELALSVARFTAFDSTWGWWWTPENGPDDGLADAEGDDENADQYVNTSWSAALSNAKPRGLPVTPQGDVIFTNKPASYAPGLNDTAKIKFLLGEAQSLDDDPNKEIASEALLEQALLFRTRDGAERIDRLRNWWWRGSYPYRDTAKDDELYKLGDDEVITLVATGVRTVTVPADESVPKLLAQVQQLYPQSKAADEAQSLLGTYFQSREQYPKAIAAYDAYLKEHAKGAHVGEVNAAKTVIEHPDLAFQSKGAQAAGKPAQVSVRFRNLDKVHFIARRVDVDHVIADFKKAWAPGPRPRNNRNDERLIEPENLGYPFVDESDYYNSKRYLAGDPISFDANVKRDPQMRYADADIPTPLEKPGVYLVQALDGKTSLSRTLVVIDKAAIVMKTTAQGPVAWVVDAKSGKPITNASVDVFFYGSTWADTREIRKSKSASAKVDEHGIAKLPQSNEMSALVTTKVDGVTVAPVQQWLGTNQYVPSESRENETVAVVVADRPVYRPGDNVELHIWARHKKDGSYSPATDVKQFNVHVYDSRNQELLAKDASATQWGSMSMSIPLAKGASLGHYRVDVTVDGSYADDAGAGFQVEEYKAPEVNVSVKSPSQARLGDKIDVEVHADYYSGGPVTAAKVSYKVFRQDHEVTYAAPTPWDWLYGIGYGRIWYRYDWFPWWKDYGPHPIVWYPWWGPPPSEPKELVQEGEGATDARGVLKVVVDTAKAKRDHGDRDHRYTIEAEVTDLSRHVVKGSGAVSVTRAAFLASLELDAGWARAGDDVNLTIATVSPDGALFPTKGTLRIEEILGVSENGAVRGAQLVEEKPIATDALGPTRTRWRAPKTGQYQFTFVAKDAQGNDVKAADVAWVMGPDFVGEKYRFAGVEIVPDKRTYQPGDVAKLLVSADHAGASVLLATKVDQGFLVDWKVIELPNKTTIVELPITKQHMPNFFVEATTVGDAQVYEEAREMYVPPLGSQLNVKVTPKKGELDPGAKDEVTVTTTDADGKPVSAEVAVSVFDSAVLAIASDTTVDVREHLWGRKRWHQPSSTSTLGRPQAVGGALAQPDQQARWALSSRSQQRFQHEIDFVHGDRDEGLLAGADALGYASAGPGGGGHAAYARAAEGETERRMVTKSAVGGLAKDEEAKADDKAPAKEQAEAPAPPPPASTPAANNKIAQDASASTGAFAPHVRSNFADTALFTVVVTDASGSANVTVPFPENLTTWKVRALGVDARAAAGRGDASIVTTKKLLVRMATPRFFRERDSLVLSAIVQNKHDKTEHVNVSLDVPEDLLSVGGSKSSNVDVPANGEVRVDFKVDVRGEGEAKVRVTAKGDDDGDAKELLFPVLVHGMQKTVSGVGSINAGGTSGEKNIVVEVPKERREDETDLVVRTSPTLAGGMIDALPYLLDYPYGCVEQTLSRFVPAVLTKRALQQSGGVKLEDLAKAHRDLNAQHLGTTGNVDVQRNDREHREYDRNPIYDTKLLNEIVDEGLGRIRKMQHGDGGWGWWADDTSSVYMTSLVLAGLLDAREADLAIDSNMIERGRSALRGEVEGEIWQYKQKNNEKYVSDSDAYALWVMSRFGDRHDELMHMLFERRVQLSPYGNLLLALAEKNLGQEGNAKLLLENVEQFRKADPENETSWIETATSGWWYWWNDDVETNALYLRALDSIRPKDNTAAPGVVKWLLNHRKHGWYWNSTRDTASVIAAFANHMQVSGERRPDYDLTISVDGKPMKTVHVDAKNMYFVDTDLRLHGKELGGGKHTITISKKGEGAVYFNTYLSYFTLEDDIKAAGLEVKVDRKYFKLVRHDRQHNVADTNGNDVNETELAYQKVPLSSGDDVKSGDLILVELTVTSKNDYTFLAFEDPKPAGAEAVAVRSGMVGGETWAHMELRDDKVVFFLPELTQGSLKLSYRLRAELPGKFSAMPTHGFAMYAPEIQANSDEMKLKIHD
jgi:uncharacterized protein YfaS (alpha-2-macroglobulin family)